MYSPKIPEHFIPALYRLARSRKRPMTQLVAEAVERYLANEGHLEDVSGREGKQVAKPERFVA